MLRRIMPLLLAALPAGLLGQSAFDLPVFKSPPARYRGHAMWNFNLTNLNEDAVVSGIHEMAKVS